MAAPAIPGDFLDISGEIDFESQTATPYFVSRESQVSQIPELVPGDYHIRLYDANNNQLADYSFTPLSDSDDRSRGFFRQVVDWVAGAQRIAIYSDFAGGEIASLDVSENAPSVAITAVSGAPNLPASGPVTIQWSGSDADGDSLSYTLLYSFNAKADWRTLVTGMSGNEVTVDASEIEGTDGSTTAYFRVVASNGVLVGSGDSEALSVGGKSLVVRIANPADGATYGYGQTVLLEGYAEDVEDGAMPDGTLSWSSDVDGFLGAGHLLDVSFLSEGTHQITLTALDSTNQSSAATIQVIIAADASLLMPSDPTLDAGPTAVQFIGEPGGSSPATQTLSIRNLAGSDIAWTASADAAWVGLAATSGSTPADIAVSVDTTGFAANSTHTAQITVESPGAANSPVVISVTVQMMGETPHLIYLPVVRRAR